MPPLTTRTQLRPPPLAAELKQILTGHSREAGGRAGLDVAVGRGSVCDGLNEHSSQRARILELDRQLVERALALAGEVGVRE